MYADDTDFTCPPPPPPMLCDDDALAGSDAYPSQQGNGAVDDAMPT